MQNVKVWWLQDYTVGTDEINGIVLDSVPYNQFGSYLQMSNMFFTSEDGEIYFRHPYKYRKYIKNPLYSENIRGILNLTGKDTIQSYVYNYDSFKGIYYNKEKIISLRPLAFTCGDKYINPYNVSVIKDYVGSGYSRRYHSYRHSHRHGYYGKTSLIKTDYEKYGNLKYSIKQKYIGWWDDGRTGHKSTGWKSHKNEKQWQPRVVRNYKKQVRFIKDLNGGA